MDPHDYNKTMRTGIFLIILGFIVVGSWTLDSPVHAKTERIVVLGTDVFSPEEILNAAGLTEKSPLSATVAKTVKSRLTQFYHKQGYTLARVWTKYQKGHLYIAIKEGKLEKILFLGRGFMTTLFMQVLMKLPHRVYNKGIVDEEVRRIKKVYHLGTVTPRIVRSRMAPGSGFKLSDIGIDFITDDIALFELHLVSAKGRGGPSIGGHSSAKYGFVPHIGYTQPNVFFDEENDFITLRMETGYNYRKSLNSEDYQGVFTHVKGFVQYDFPHIINLLRFYTETYADTSSAQRKDLPLEEYWSLSLLQSFNLAFDFSEGMTAHVGSGLEYLNIYSIVPVKKDTFRMTPFYDPRPFISAGFSFDFSPETIFLDQHHLLDINYHYRFLKTGKFHRLEMSYQKYFYFWFNDLIIRSKILFDIGPTPFYDELPLGGSLMRTFFGGLYYVDNAAWLSFEYRQSVWKDIIKLSIFHDFTVFGEITRDKSQATKGHGESNKLRVANAFGPGFHWLALDTFRLDFYYSFGFAPSGFGHNFFFTFFKIY